jgi:hypothetical protein
LSGKVEKSAVLGFVQTASAEACVAVTRSTVKARLLRKAFTSGSC